MLAMPPGRPDWHVRWGEGSDDGGAALWQDETGPAYGKMHWVMVGEDGRPAGTLRNVPHPDPRLGLVELALLLDDDLREQAAQVWLRPVDGLEH